MKSLQRRAAAIAALIVFVFSISIHAATIYVNSAGSDSNSGVSPAAPLATFKAAKAKHPTTIALARGSKWHDQIIADYPMTVCDYGSGDPPTLTTWNNALQVRSNDVTLRNIRAQAIRGGGQPAVFYGVDVIGSRVTLAGLDIMNFPYNYFIHGASHTARVADVTLDGCISRDAWGSEKSQGIYATNVDRLRFFNWLCERCGFKNTNFNEADRLSHGAYISEECGAVLIDGALVRNCGSYGLQIRPGGIVRNFRIEDCPVGLKMGQRDSLIENGIIVGSRRQGKADGGAGWGIDTNRNPKLSISNVKIGWKGFSCGGGPAIMIRNNDAAYIPSNPDSIALARNTLPKSETISIENVLIYNWRTNFAIDAQMTGGSISILNSKIMQDGAAFVQNGTTLTPKAMKIVSSGAAKVFAGNSISIVTKPNSIIDGGGVDLPARVPMELISKP